MSNRLTDMVGVVIGSVTGVRRIGTSASGDALWEFQCPCGGLFVATGYAVRSGNRKSCSACSKRRTVNASVTHGLTDSQEYTIWSGMKARCLNKNAISYHRYGGRGISICARWESSFDNFLLDMGSRPSRHHSIDRVDNDGDYTPENCRWASHAEQANNKRNNVQVVIGGITKTIAQWAAEKGVKPATLYRRYRANNLRGSAIFESPIMKLTHNGVTDTIQGWSLRTGIKPTTINMRINKYGWPTARALNQEV